MYFFLKFFKNEENLKKNTSTSGCIEKYISLVKMYKKIRNRKIELKKKIISYTHVVKDAYTNHILLLEIYQPKFFHRRIKNSIQLSFVKYYSNSMIEIVPKLL